MFLVNLAYTNKEYPHPQQELYWKFLCMLDVSGRRGLARLLRDSARPTLPEFLEDNDEEWEEEESRKA